MATPSLLGVFGPLLLSFGPAASEDGLRKWPKAVVLPPQEVGTEPSRSRSAQPDDTNRSAKAAEDHYRLARWCEQRGHSERAEEQARLAIKEDPDHAGARALLGHAWTGKRWLPSDPAALQKYVHDLQADVNARFQQLVSPDPKRREQAHQTLLLIAKRERIPEVEVQAKRLYAEAGAFYGSVQRRVASTSRPRGVLELRLTHSKLKGIRDRTVGTGNGAPVNLQLPELQSTSIRTTTVVPLGGG